MKGCASSNLRIERFDPPDMEGIIVVTPGYADCADCAMRGVNF